LLSSLSVINHRIALELIYFGELTQKEVAERMGVSAVSVRRYKKQAIEALRRA
jgi:RNA polymerase sigma factor (sigma-70 family)